MKGQSEDLTIPSRRPIQTWNASIPCLHTWLRFGSGWGAGCNIPMSRLALYSGDGARLLKFWALKDILGCGVPPEVRYTSQLEAKTLHLGRNPGRVLELSSIISNLPWKFLEGLIYPFYLRHLDRRGPRVGLEPLEAFTSRPPNPFGNPLRSLHSHLGLAQIIK